MLDRSKALADTVAARLCIALGYVAGGLVFVFVFPSTPDEVGRITGVRGVLEGEPYRFFWPPGNLLTILANPLFHLGLMNDLHAVRVFNFAISAVPIVVVLLRCPSPGLLLAAPFLFPYAWLVTATASQQGLMLALLICLLWCVVDRRSVGVFAAGAALYLVNPAMIVVVPGALLALWPLGRARGGQLGIAAAAYLPMALLVAVAWAVTGEFSPTLSGNGAYNLFLGNNPHPLSHRGVEAADTASRSGADVVAFLTTDPAGFAANLGRKLSLYWMPWDHLRSGMGGGREVVVFAYIAFAQVLIYVTLWRMRRAARPDALAVAIALALLAWLLYSAFFVKVRFRVPFDLVLFFACMIPRDGRTQDHSPGRSG